MKIASIVGARPQFIKLAPLSKEIKKYHDEVIIHTGQHFDPEMSSIFFAQLGIEEPDYNLGINMGHHGEQTGRMLIALEEVIKEEKPELVIVFGDTNSTLAGSLVCSKLLLPVVHVEAGLRSFNKAMPEEINRIIADHSSDYLFAPSQTALNNLQKENLSSRAFLTGDIMVDSLKYAVNSGHEDFYKDYNVNSFEYYLVTLHRPYNVDDPSGLERILTGLGELTKKVIFPVHPRTRRVIDKNNIKLPDNIYIINPVGYISFINLQLNSLKIITDSGGIQKEAYILKKPCITLRSETEWVETVDSGWNLLINPAEETELAKKIESFEPPEYYRALFGVDVAEKMVQIINKISA